MFSKILSKLSTKPKSSDFCPQLDYTALQLQNGRRFSIVTTKKLIDCKIWEWQDFVDDPVKLAFLKVFLLEGAAIASQEGGKTYQLNFLNPLPETLEELRLWCKANNIDLEEGSPK